MSDEYLAEAIKLRAQLRQQRRGLIAEALNYDALGEKSLENLIRIQKAIEALDGAVTDEESVQPSVYETRGLLGV